jgi:membrane-associated protease RseP (regulator of RpoE activity)
LFAATALSIVIVHRLNHGPWQDLEGWLSSAVFAGVLLGILGLHEMGHHFVARRHGMHVSWPLFLPAPFFVGTLGAILRVHDRPRSRTALLEMGASGPISGFLALTAIWAVRLWLGGPVQEGGEVLARPLLWWALSAPLPGPVPLLTTDDPAAYAGWVGALVTAMNLLPFGQLDGGHVACAIDPEQSRRVGWITSAILLGVGFAWMGWWAWLLAIHLMATRHPMFVVESSRPLTPRARRVAWLAAAVFLCCFTPIPW